MQLTTCSKPAVHNLLQVCSSQFAASLQFTICSKSAVHNLQQACSSQFAASLQFTTCSKSAVRNLQQVCSSQLAASLLTTCSRLVVIKPEQAMRTHPDISLMIATCSKSAADLLQLARFWLCTPFMFNFFSWLLGFLEDAQACEYVEVDEKHAARVFSVCQDLINISSKGKIQTPKSLALAMAVRQITGCSKLINILNGLGHCVSLSSTMTFDSALAQLTINTSSIIPRNFVAEEYINLVFDNIDFGEEISKQTHVTNGIITQKITIQNESELRHFTVIKKSQRTVEVPPSVISEYHLGAKKRVYEAKLCMKQCNVCVLKHSWTTLMNRKKTESSNFLAKCTMLFQMKVFTSMLSARCLRKSATSTTLLL